MGTVFMGMGTGTAKYTWGLPVSLLNDEPIPMITPPGVSQFAKLTKNLPNTIQEASGDDKLVMVEFGHDP
jgi:hypothetical protein